MGEAHRPGTRTALLVASILAVAGQLWGVYRPTPPPGDPLFPHLDKVLHALGFALPVALLLFLLNRFSVWVLGLFAVHAPVSELVQSAFYRRRSGDPWDIAADLVGVALGVGVFWAARRRRPRPAETAHG